MKCTFRSNFTPKENVPTTYKEAVDFASKFIQISNESMAKDPTTGRPLGVPCIVWLCPLKLIRGCEEAPSLKNQISHHFAAKCVQLIQNCGEIEEKLYSMLNDDPLAKTLTPYYKKLKDFKGVYSWFRDELKEKLK